MSNNWVVENLSFAFRYWNDRLLEIWNIITQNPQDFKGGTIWNVISGFNGSMKGIGYGLLVVFLAMGIFGSTMTFKDFQRPETAIRHFLRFVLAKLAVTHALELLLMIFSIVGGVVGSFSSELGDVTEMLVELPSSVVTDIESVGFLNSIPLWFVTVIGIVAIIVLAFLLTLIIYGRFFRIFLSVSLSPLPLSSFAGEGTSSHGKKFLQHFTGLCLEGVIVVVCCVIFAALSSSMVPGLAPDGEVVTRVWMYLIEVAFNMLLLVAMIMGADKLAKEMFGL